MSSADFAAIIAAGGSGSRFGTGKNKDSAIKQDKPKQFLYLRGLPLYAWSLLAFGRHQLISRIVIIVPAQLIDEIETESKDLAAQHNFKATITVAGGGKSRQESVFRGLKQLEKLGSPPSHVLVQDAARPFLDSRTIDVMTEMVIKCGACTVGGAVSDTIKRVEGGKIIETLPRDELRAVQTPQAAAFAQLLHAHEEAALAGYATTDDAALLEWAGQDVYIVDGPRYNPKITGPLDLMLAEALADYLSQDLL